MPLVAADMKALFQKRIHSGLARVFASDTDSRVDAQWMKMADAISDIAIDLVLEITTKAQVVPGQAVATPAGPGVTVAPGKIA